MIFLIVGPENRQINPSQTSINLQHMSKGLKILYILIKINYISVIYL